MHCTPISSPAAWTSTPRSAEWATRSRQSSGSATPRATSSWRSRPSNGTGPRRCGQVQRRGLTPAVAGTWGRMKAVTFHGKRDVRVDDVPDPTIQEPTDAIVRVTSSGICGSDLHLYEVLAPFLEEGDIIGHEPMGIVE